MKLIPIANGIPNTHKYLFDISVESITPVFNKIPFSNIIDAK